jgi:serine/threonine-protein phosphatase 5
LNAIYGFERECTSKYDQGIYEECAEFFNTLPLGHLINGEVFVVHGGLFSDPKMTIRKFQSVNRFRQPPEEGPFNDLLWSDPMDHRGLAASPRGTTKLFGPDVTEKFLQDNQISLIIRSHQIQDGGYALHHGGKCVTVFSAPNYIEQVGNKGAVCHITFVKDGSLKPPKFTQFVAQPVPPKYRAMKYASLMPGHF